VIDVADLCYSYPGAERRAVDDLTFAVERGEIFGFLGPNGAGKSTTQRVLIGLLRDYAGQVSMLGRSLGEWGSDFYEHVGVVFEFPNHYLKLTARENLAYFRALYGQSTEAPRELLERVGLADDGDMPVGQFSKGMKSRLSIARALLNDPELLFLDEPTAGLDPVGGRNIKELIREQKAKGKTVFLTTHDMTVADQLCDRVAFIVDGCIDLIDSPRELKLRHGEHRVRLEYLDRSLAEPRPENREFLLADLGDNEEFLHLLRTTEVQTLHTLEATLEDVFVEVTGQRLR
jgi:fluoroquinolone transport system ATP-binding protein